MADSGLTPDQIAEVRLAAQPVRPVAETTSVSRAALVAFVADWDGLRVAGAEMIEALDAHWENVDSPSRAMRIVEASDRFRHLLAPSPTPEPVEKREAGNGD